ncbi:MAG: hypothetical protein B7Z75_03385 [Acidocella sp. 20-57-95]|nr:MAG: hypothetical protein B7Z75_03385 [Acidocella sp. 20-57-95]OYV61638.1 MAG: hypothetical protein B7Z71_04315 [Acidocella sp. 21-58-7]HQT64715.1 DUF4115 domain-containing protein [Acidocella sp.]HQU03519.1 DUF4115 domain-containing protein [Acidocella sp.]
MDHPLETGMLQDESGSPITGAARVGIELRGVRERLGWRLTDLAAQLRIREPYLAAIESGNLALLPGAAYQAGFVRTYAQALGLDGEEILRRFRAEGSGVNAKAELSFPAPVPDRGVPTGALVLLCLLLALGGYGVWYVHTASQAKLAAAVPSVPVDLAPLAVSSKPPEPPAPPKLDASAAPSMSSAQPPLAAGAQTISPAPPTAPPVPAATSPVTSTMPASNGKTIQATGDDWVEVKDSKGNILFSKLLHAGDSWPVPDMPGLTMTAGNAGATSIFENGKAGAPLGAASTVLHDYPLTAATPGSATTVPAPSTTPPAKTN